MLKAGHVWKECGVYLFDIKKTEQKAYDYDIWKANKENGNVLFFCNNCILYFVYVSNKWRENKEWVRESERHERSKKNRTY